VEPPPYDDGYRPPADTDHPCVNEARTAAETQLFHAYSTTIRRGGIEERLEAQIVALDTASVLEYPAWQLWQLWQERLRQGLEVHDPRSEPQVPLILAAARAFRTTGREVRIEQPRPVFPFPPDYRRSAVPDVIVAPVAYAGELDGLVPWTRLPVVVEVEARPAAPDICRRDRVLRREGLIPLWLCIGQLPRTLRTGPDGVHAFAAKGAGLDPDAWCILVGRSRLALIEFAAAWVGGRVSWASGRGYEAAQSPPHGPDGSRSGRDRMPLSRRRYPSITPAPPTAVAPDEAASR
jgi:hypothetical protein